MAKGSYETQTPLIVSGCIGWMDGADTATNNITSSGGFVSKVRNKADSQNPFVQATGANQPQTGVSTVAGRNVITLNGSNSYLSCNALSAYFTGEDAPVSCFAVYRPTSIVGQRVVFCAGNSGSSQNLFMHDNGDTSSFRIFKRINAGTITQVFTTYSPISIPVMMSMSCPGTTIKAYKNGVSFANGAFNAGTVPLNTFALGVRPGATLSNYYAGDICETIFYNRGLTDDEVDIIESYLARKWGIAIS